MILLLRHAEWIQNFFVKRDVDLSGGGTFFFFKKKKLHMKYTQETKRRAVLLNFWNEFLIATKTTVTNSPDFLVGWALWHNDADIITFMEDGSVRHNASWKYSPERSSIANDHELRNALQKDENTKPKVQGCLACGRGINVNLGRKHTFDCRQTMLPSVVTDSSLDGEIRRRWKGRETS